MAIARIAAVIPINGNTRLFLSPVCTFPEFLLEELLLLLLLLFMMLFTVLLPPLLPLLEFDPLPLPVPPLFSLPDPFPGFGSSGFGFSGFGFPGVGFYGSGFSGPGFSDDSTPINTTADFPP